MVHFCIVCNHNDYGEHHSWIPLVLPIKQSKITLADSYVKINIKCIKKYLSNFLSSKIYSVRCKSYLQILCVMNRYSRCCVRPFLGTFLRTRECYLFKFVFKSNVIYRIIILLLSSSVNDGHIVFKKLCWMKAFHYVFFIIFLI